MTAAPDFLGLFFSQGKHLGDDFLQRRVFDAHVFDAVLIQDRREQLRYKLLLPPAPRLAQYAATGPLLGWMRVILLRIGLDLRIGARLRNDETLACEFDEQPPSGLHGPDGRRQPHAHGRPHSDRLESLEREREVRAALVARERVDLVDDHRLDRLERRARALGAQV